MFPSPPGEEHLTLIPLRGRQILWLDSLERDPDLDLNPMTCAIHKIPRLHSVRFNIWILRGEIQWYSCGCIKDME